MLSVIGLDADSERVYDALIGPAPATIAELETRTRLPAGRVRTAIRKLQGAGLARRGDRAPANYAAVDPATTIAARLASQEAELVRAARRVQDLSERFQLAAAAHEPSRLIEVITGAAAIVRRVNEVERSARKELRILDRPPYHGGPIADEGEHDVLRRGGRVRAIYAKSSLEIPGRFADIQRSVDAGEHARVLPELPVKLALADDRLAVLPLRAGPRLSPSFVVVHRSALLDGLGGLFETLWQLGTPIALSRTTTEDPGKPSAPDQRLITLLTAGIPDETIARQLDTSYRTVQRRIHTLMAQVGADTRFQLGVQIERRGWLGNSHADR